MSVHISAPVWRLKLLPVPKLILLKVADCADDDGRSWPSVARIAEECAVSERTVQRTLRTLESCGLITLEREQRDHLPRMYIVRPERGVMVAPRPAVVLPPRPAVGVPPETTGVPATTDRGDTMLAPDPLDDPSDDPSSALYNTGDNLSPRDDEPAAIRPAKPLDQAFLDGLIAEFAPQVQGGEERVRLTIDNFLNKRTSAQYRDKRAALRNWLKADVLRFPVRSEVSAGRPPPSNGHTPFRSRPEAETQAWHEKMGMTW